MIIGESDLVLIPAEATRSIAIVDFARSEEVAPIYYTVLITMPRRDRICYNRVNIL